MAKYRLLIRKPAAEELGRVPKKELGRIVERIQALAGEPRPKGCEKLSAQERYRIRQGDYRIVYVIDDGERTVEVAKIGHRSEVSRDRGKLNMKRGGIFRRLQRVNFARPLTRLPGAPDES